MHNRLEHTGEIVCFRTKLCAFLTEFNFSKWRQEVIIDNEPIKLSV